MAPTDPPATVLLRVKVPPGSIPGGADEFTLGTEVPVTARIGQVRDRIQRSIPSNPTPEQQRLLYGGRALVDNEQTLAEALNMRRDPSQLEYVIHLLVRNDNSNTTSSSHRLGMNTPTRSASPSHSQASVPPQPQQHNANSHTHHNLPQQTQQLPSNPLLRPTVHGHHQGFHAQFQLNSTNLNRLENAQEPLPFRMQPVDTSQNLSTHHPQQAMPAGSSHLAPHAHQNQTTHAPSIAQAGSQNSEIPQHTDQDRAREPREPRDPRAQQANLDGAPAQQHAFHHPPRRPISNQGFHMEGIGPNGERITVHHQMMNIPHGMFPAPPQMQLPLHPQIHGFPGPLPGMAPSLPGRPQGPSALDVARENIADARRRLDVLRRAHEPGSEINTPALDQEVSQIERRIEAVSDYIDPMRLGTIPNGSTRTPSPSAAPDSQALPPPAVASFVPNNGWQQRAQALRAQQQGLDTTGSDVTCYLLSSPSGPHAILYSPQHGTFHGSLPVEHNPSTSAGSQSNPTTAVATVGDDTRPGENAPNQDPIAQPDPAQGPAAQQDPLGPLAPVFNHLWLLLRILIFSYFLLGANMGWRRPLALLAIGLGFWMMRTGLLAEGAALRRWWDGVMNLNQQPPREPREPRNGQAEGQGQQQQDEQQRLRPGQMPTPEQVAQRLLNEDARLRNDRLRQLREYLRPIERALALLFASLWPGVGEAYVRAREAEERRRAEEEIATRRREEEERQRNEEAEKSKIEEGSSGNDESGETPSISNAKDSSSQKAPGTAAEHEP